MALPDRFCHLGLRGPLELVYCTHGPTNTKVDRCATVVGMMLMQNVVKKDEKLLFENVCHFSLREPIELVYCTHGQVHTKGYRCATLEDWVVIRNYVKSMTSGIL